MTDKKLYEKVQDAVEVIRKHSPEIIKIPNYITGNLKHNLFDWQKEALEFLLYYEHENSNLKQHPTHLMFNMATGSGKTLVMAASILYYYKQGYRHFLFFVNQNNIVDKTENNFIDPTHSKYLFSNNIVIDDKTIRIEKVESFSDSPENIEIKFTTIQQLYNDIHLERENRVILEELDDKNIVMLADEAHHLNTRTQNQASQLELNLTTEITGQTGAAEIERKGWEHTVIDLILNKRGKKSENVLLEYTATIPDSVQVQEKYKDKIIYKFDLKEFLGAGYTKEINLISSRFNKKERILHALLFNWYREQIALKYYRLGNKSLANFKPVVLFRSKTIEESERDFEEFKHIIGNLNASDFSFLNDIETKLHDSKSIYEQGKSRTLDIFKYIDDESISYSRIAEDIKYNFSEKNCIITNSADNTTKTEKTTDEQEKLLNSLEDKSNHIRAIFTVKRLTEGWDVLNLFDIVRLYQGQNAGGSSSKTPRATTEEKQLIGRGVRYYPFEYNNKIINKRKFDDNPLHELRVLEELYYYTYDEDSKYISHLKNELRRDGYIKDGKVQKTFAIKDEFKNSPFFKESVMWVNDRVENPDRQKKNLNDIKDSWNFDYKLNVLEYSEEELELDEERDIKRLDIVETASKTLKVTIKDFDRHIFHKAINIKSQPDNSILRFNNLKKVLSVESIDDLLREEFLGSFVVNIRVPEDITIDKISNENKLKILLKLLDKFTVELKDYINPYIGTEFKPKKMSEIFGEPKVKIVEEDEESLTLAARLKGKNWYVLNDFIGTSEEKGLIEDIMGTTSNLQNNYQDVYLLRNEEVYKIYDFETGRGFQPDFILLLRDKQKGDLFYHVLMEPKGDGIKDKDEWKNDFLKEISRRYSMHENDFLTFETDTYVLIGLPLYNLSNKKEFMDRYEAIWNK